MHSILAVYKYFVYVILPSYFGQTSLILCDYGTMKQSLILLLGSALLSAAWMPADKSLWGKPKPKPNHRELKSKRWLPGYEIRGVNLGAMFIIEPWMAGQEWTSMGCDGQCSEFDCVSHLGQDKANAAWDTHWKTWITTADLDEMKSYGLNTIRIPVGYWIREDIVYSDSEHFPQGGLKYLDALVGAASDRGMYIIIDHHGVPGAQQAKQPFTGQVDYQSILSLSVARLIHGSAPPPQASTTPTTNTNVRTNSSNG